MLGGMNPQTLSKPFARLLARPDLASAANAFTIAAQYSRKWDTLVAESIKIHGERKGAHISGIYSDHFPQVLQDTLRGIARSVSFHSDAAYRLRPSGVRASTMRNLRLAIHARDGSGFYG